MTAPVPLKAGCEWHSDDVGARYVFQLTDAYINWNHFDFANVKAGQFKTPFGYEQLYADPKLFTIERTSANDRLTVSRQIGVQELVSVASQFLGAIHRDVGMFEELFRVR